jgi:tetratricopeptide (TPR) repeat protein
MSLSIPNPRGDPEISADTIRRHIERILSHSLFAKARLQRAFLRYIVERTLAGESESLKEYTVGRDVFGRGDSFDPQTDNVVRVNANRLRSRLAEYYLTEGHLEAVVIDVPRGAYLPVFRAVSSPRETPLLNAPPAKTSVGREPELRRLAEALQRARHGHSTLAAVSGDAGIGKTTLVEDFIEPLPAGLCIASGRCSELLTHSDPYVPILELLDGMVHAPHGERVHNLMAQHAPAWLAQVAPGEQASSVGGVPPSKERMRREFAHFFRALAEDRPVILFLDDMHWADASTCDLLTALPPALRLLTVVTFREAELTAAAHPFRALHVAWARQGNVLDIPLGLLKPADVNAYLARCFPMNELPAGLADVIYRRTEGHPLFMVDLVSHLREQGFVTFQDGRWLMHESLERILTVVPATTQRMIRLQMDRFTTEEAGILRCAAVRGMSFDSAVISSALALDPGAVEETLRGLERVHRFVTPEAEEPAASGPLMRYRFTHVLYQHALYGDIAPARRAALSRLVAEAMRERLGSASRSEAATIAMLFEAGGDFGCASEHFLQAASHAASLFAFPETVALCERGLRVLANTPESPERDAHELSLSIILGMAQMSVCGFAAPEVDRTHRRARELCLALGDHRHLVRILWRLHTCQVNAGNLVRALELAEEMIQVAKQVGTKNAMVESLHAHGSTLGFMGRLAEARASFERIFEIAPLTEHKFDTSIYFLDPHVTSLSLFARLVCMTGDFEDALAKAEASLKLATRLAHPPSVTYATFWIGWIRNIVGQHEQALRHLEVAMELARAHGLPQFVEWGRIVLGSSLAALGRTAEGIAEMRRSLDNQLAMHSGVGRPYCLTMLAEAVLRAGDPREAVALCTEALEIGARTEDRDFEAESHRVRAEALVVLGKRAEGEADFARALDIARFAGCGAIEKRVLASLSRDTGQIREYGYV